MSNTVHHRDDEFDRDFFPSLRDMQERHFWYKGRHRFLFQSVKRCFSKYSMKSGELSAIDMGGGCGGWIKYLLQKHDQLPWKRLALADSSLEALSFSEAILPAAVSRHQIDLLNLIWNAEWDVVFLLDVLEHIPTDDAAMRKVFSALRPGGLLFVTVPALAFFWSVYDDDDGHQRRYSKSSLATLAESAGLEIVDVRYFQFFLSPLFLLSRWVASKRFGGQGEMTRKDHHIATHKVPSWLVNGFLTGVFCSETPFGHWVRFPWGTSCLGVFRKPERSHE